MPSALAAQGGRPHSPHSPSCLKAAEAGHPGLSPVSDRLRLVPAGPDSRSRFSIRVRVLRPRAPAGGVRSAGNELADACPAPARTSLDPTWRRGRGLGAGVTVAWRLASQPTRPSPQSRPPSPGLPVGRKGVRRGDTEPGKRGLGCLPAPPLGRSSRPRSRPRRSGVRSALRRSGTDRGPIQCCGAHTGETAAQRIAGRLSPAGLRLATPIIMTVDFRSGLRSRRSRDQQGPGIRASGSEGHELDCHGAGYVLITRAQSVD